MAAASKKPFASATESLPQLPLDAQHWQAILKALRLSPRQSEIALLILRGAELDQIAEALGIKKPTVRTQMERLYRRAHVRDRMELAMRMLAVSHEVIEHFQCHQR